MEDFQSETDSDYTSYWRDWVGPPSSFPQNPAMLLSYCSGLALSERRNIFSVVSSGHQPTASPSHPIVTWCWKRSGSNHECHASSFLMSHGLSKSSQDRPDSWRRLAASTCGKRACWALVVLVSYHIITIGRLHSHHEWSKSKFCSNVVCLIVLSSC